MNAKGARNLVFISQTKMLKQPFTFFPAYWKSQKKSGRVAELFSWLYFKFVALTLTRLLVHNEGHARSAFQEWYKFIFWRCSDLRAELRTRWYLFTWKWYTFLRTLKVLLHQCLGSIEKTNIEAELTRYCSSGKHLILRWFPSWSVHLCRKDMHLDVILVLQDLIS